ncbi:MAG: extracellular solute-binding protein [Limnochordia bacterium]|jgi:ABC-type glycerol-3-phosphate transport system substrate-binding protein
MKLRRTYAILVLSMIAVLGVVGAEASEAIVFRTWWGLTGPRIELLDSMLQQFEAETGIQVEYESPATNTTQYLDRLIIDSVTGMDIDVVLTGGMWTADVIDAGIVRPLDDYLARVPELKNDIFPAIWDGVTYQGQVWALPFAGGPQRVTFQNKDMFMARGLEPGEAAVASWESFSKYAQRLTQDLNGDGQPDVFGIQDVRNQVYAFYWPNGADLFNADRSDFGFTSPEAIGALEFMLELQQRNVVGGTFAAATSGMTVSTGPFSLQSFRATLPFDLAMTLPPQNTPTRRTLSSLDLLTLASSSSRSEAGWEFIMFLLRPDVHANWAVQTGFPPVRQSEVRTRVFQTAINSDPLYRVLGDMYDAAVLWPLYPDSVSIWNILRSAVTSAFRGEPPRAALENAQRQAQQYLVKE